MRHLQGLLPFCPRCQGQREEEEYWQAVENCLEAQMEVQFFPAICPKCDQRRQTHSSPASSEAASGQPDAADRLTERDFAGRHPVENVPARAATFPCCEAAGPAEAEPARETVPRLRAALQAQALKYAALQTSEAYFRHLTEYSLDLITILDMDGTVRFESRSIERELGHAPEHYRGRNAFDFVHPEDRPLVMQAFAGALQGHGNTALIRFRFLHADGTYRLLEGSGNNLLEDPAVRGLVFNSRNITERQKLEREIEQVRAEKEDTVARLTGGVAHDFNNILTAIQGLAELAEARLRHTPEVKYLGEIRTATRRAHELTQQLLAISRQVVLRPRALALGPWLKGIEPRLAAILGREIELTLAAHGDLPVWEDPAQLEQVILQLATNAREAMPVGGRLTIEAQPIVLAPHERPSDGRHGDVGYVQLTVADQGAGMDEATLARIFEPFFTTKIVGHHPGLGLSMCRGIIEQSGGHLTVQSHPGRGTVFRLYLPATDAVADEPPAVSVPPAAPGVATILLVDDEPMLREIGETILADAGYRVIVAEDGAEALARLAELDGTSIDLLLTDVIMPGMNGVQLAAEVERLRPGTRVLLCSGYTRDAFAASGGLPSGVAFLSKPYTLAMLLEKVAELLSAKVS
jgi:PAS domain S-box-containing protein